VAMELRGVEGDIIIPKCSRYQNFGVNSTLKLNKTSPSQYFVVVKNFEKFYLKSSFSIENLILKMNDYDFSIQDVIQDKSLPTFLKGVGVALELWGAMVDINNL